VCVWGGSDDAIELVKRSLKLAPHNADAWNSLGNMLVAGNNEKSRRVRVHERDQPEARLRRGLVQLANLFRRQRRRNEAVNCYRRRNRTESQVCRRV
jgi:hypothetical protein